MGNNPLSRLQGRIGLGVCLAGFVVLFLGWNGAASHADLRQQFPYLLSGGLVGLGLIVVGAALLIVEALRAEQAQLRELLEELQSTSEARRSAVNGNGATGTGDLPAIEGLVLAGQGGFHRPACRVIEGQRGLEAMEAEAALGIGLTPCRICRPAELVHQQP